MDSSINGKVNNIQLNKSVFFVEIQLKRNTIDTIDDLRFVLVNRDSSDEFINLAFKTKNTNEDMVVFHVEVDSNQFKINLESNIIWDMYYEGNIGEETKRVRIKCDDEHLRFLSVLFKEKSKMFYPFTTVKNNLSFRVNKYTLFANIDSIKLLNSGQLLFTGIFNYPPLLQSSEYKILDTTLVVTNTFNEAEERIPLESIERIDILKKYGGNNVNKDIGFKGLFDPKDYMNFDEKIFFKFYLELKIINNRNVEIVRSGRIKVLRRLKKESGRIVLKIGGNKKRIRFRSTKKRAYLSFVIEKYKRVPPIKQLKSKWIRIRRGRKFRELYKLIFSILGKLPANNKLIIFESFGGKQYSDSPRAIYEYMVRHHPEYKMYWSFDREHIGLYQDRNLKTVRRYSLKWLFLMPRAKYWVVNSRLPLWLPKPDHNVYLQTWHGTPLKRLAADMKEVHMPGTNTEKYKRNFINEASRWDYLVSPNAYSTEIFKRAFQFEGKMIESGYPRNDFLINSNNKKTIEPLKTEMKLPLDKKVILYAPTWRDNQFYRKGKYKFDIQLNLDQMKKSLSDDYIILLRLHYLVAENLDLTGYEDFVYDFSKHEDIRELYLISDMLITDYSSVFFDYANLKRPMLFYVYDIDDYRDNLRGFYFDFEENAPGPLVKTTEEIITVIKDYEENGFTPSENIEEFYDKFCYLEDGNATSRVVNEVFK